MARLNQIIAVEKGAKNRNSKMVTELYHTLQKPDLFNGFIRTYHPDNEESGERFPNEEKRVQHKVDSIIDRFTLSMTEYFDLVLQKDDANCSARADVKVEGRVIARNVPVTTLIYLEKQLTDIATFIEKMPVVDSSEAWEVDSSLDLFVTKPTETVKTKKEPSVITKAAATQHHPAQTELYYEDRRVGRWSNKKMSGAMQQRRMNELLGRVELLKRAVKFAREEANQAEVQNISMGKEIFEFIFRG